MKTLDQITKALEVFEKKYGMPVVGSQQGSAVWFNMKLGVISASHASEVVSKKGTATRLTYMAELVSQVATGVMEEINSKYLDWGNQHEGAARSTYAFENNVEIIELPFVYKDESHREGCSPDGIIKGLEKGMEIKCPYDAANYIKFLTGGFTKPEYIWQNQYTLRVLEADEWDFSQYHPHMKVKPMHTLTVKRDTEKQKAFDDLIPAFIYDMDKMLADVGVKFGDQWTRLATPQDKVG